MAESKRPLLVYDGICNLCISAVRFLHAIDRHQSIAYMPYQHLKPQFRRQHGLSAESLQGRMHLVSTSRPLLSGPTAITEVCKLLFPFGFVCNLFRTPPIQRLYEWIATRRYRIFGCSDACYVLPSRRK